MQRPRPDRPGAGTSSSPYNLIHDNIGTGCGSVHIDALDLYMVEGVIRGNRIWACGTQCIFTGDPARC